MPARRTVRLPVRLPVCLALALVVACAPAPEPPDRDPIPDSALDAAADRLLDSVFRPDAPRPRPPTERWVELLAGDAVTIWIDTERSRRQADGTLMLWLRWDYEPPRMVGDPPRWGPAAYSMQQWEVDCAAVRSRYRYVGYYAVTDRPLGANEPGEPTAWADAVPESVAEHVIDRACVLDARGGLAGPDR